MAMLEKHRSSIYRSLVPILGEEEAQALVGQFPARDQDEPATKHDLALLKADLRTEMADLRIDLRTEMADLRTDLRTEMADLRTEMADLRTDLRTEMRDLHLSSTRWLVTTMLAIAAIQTAAIPILVNLTG
jgi:hypothetical protein